MGNVNRIKPMRPIIRTALPIGTLLLLVVAAYAKATGFEFTHWDDGYYVVDNPVIRSLSPPSLYAAFSRFFMGNYAPLQIVSYAADYRVWGLNPFGFHLSNMVLHALNAVALFFLVKNITGRSLSGWIAAALFAVHPLNVEAVAWVAQRKTLLAQFFFLLAFLEYLDWTNGKKRGRYILSSALFAASLLSKVSTITLPLLLVLYDVCYRDRSVRCAIADKIPFFFLSGLFAALALIAQSSAYHGVFAYHGGSLLGNAFTTIVAVARYVVNIFYPVHLSAYYYFSYSSMFSYPVLGSLLLLFFVGVLLYRGRKNKPVLFWAGWFFIALIPNLQLIPLDAVMADRYLYLPAIGAYVLMGSAWEGLRHAWSDSPFAHRSIVICGAGILVLFGLVSFQRLNVWQDDYALWSATAREDPSPMAYNNLAAYWGSAGELEKAKEALEAALRIEPNDFMATKNMGKLLAMKRDFPGAVAYLARAARISPRDEDLSITLASVYADQGKIEEAGKILESFVKQNPDWKEAREKLLALKRGAFIPK